MINNLLRIKMELMDKLDREVITYVQYSKLLNREVSKTVYEIRNSRLMDQTAKENLVDLVLGLSPYNMYQQHKLSWKKLLVMHLIFLITIILIFYIGKII